MTLINSVLDQFSITSKNRTFTQVVFERHREEFYCAHDDEVS